MRPQPESQPQITSQDKIPADDSLYNRFDRLGVESQQHPHQAYSQHSYHEFEVQSSCSLYHHSQPSTQQRGAAAAVVETNKHFRHYCKEQLRDVEGRDYKDI